MDKGELALAGRDGCGVGFFAGVCVWGVGWGGRDIVVLDSIPGKRGGGGGGGGWFTQSQGANLSVKSRTKLVQRV